MQLWGAADQLILAFIYGLFAGGRYQERWGHLAAWLGMIGGGSIAIVFSHGHGSLAAKGALIAAVMILAERALYSLKERETIRRRSWAFIRLAWGLYQCPLLVADGFGRNYWFVSGPKSDPAGWRSDTADLGSRGTSHHQRVICSFSPPVSQSTLRLVLRHRSLYALDNSYEPGLVHVIQTNSARLRHQLDRPGMVIIPIEFIHRASGTTGVWVAFENGDTCLVALLDALGSCEY